MLIALTRVVEDGTRFPQTFIAYGASLIRPIHRSGGVRHYVQEQHPAKHGANPIDSQKTHPRSADNALAHRHGVAAPSRRALLPRQENS